MLRHLISSRNQKNIAEELKTSVKSHRDVPIANYTILGKVASLSVSCLICKMVIKMWRLLETISVKNLTFNQMSTGEISIPNA